MDDSHLLKITKENLDKFLAKVIRKGQLYAPVKTDSIRFRKILDPNEIYLQENSDFPLKGFFFRNREMLFRFKGTEVTWETENPGVRVFFGVRRCDLNAIRHQDLVFLEKYKDPYYSAQRKDSYLIGYHCDTAPSKYCFCASMDLVDYHDMMLFDKGNYYLVHIGSQKGRDLIEMFSSKTLFKETGLELREEDKKIDAHRLKDRDISGLHEHPDWSKGIEKCLSCAACTTLCPTCYCHEVKDETNLTDLKSGQRLREWSSCQLKSFTRVAGDHVFRDKRDDRFKHRIYHQLQYFRERYGIDMCTGCGRCITHCPTQIDFVEIINGMKKDGR